MSLIDLTGVPQLPAPVLAALAAGDSLSAAEEAVADAAIAAACSELRARKLVDLSHRPSPKPIPSRSAEAVRP